MKNENIRLIVLFILALAFQIWILNQVGKHSESKRYDDQIIMLPSDQELDSIEFMPVMDERAFIIDGDTLATENI